MLHLGTIVRRASTLDGPLAFGCLVEQPYRIRVGIASDGDQRIKQPPLLGQRRFVIQRHHSLDHLSASRIAQGGDWVRRHAITLLLLHHPCIVGSRSGASDPCENASSLTTTSN